MKTSSPALSIAKLRDSQMEELSTTGLTIGSDLLNVLIKSKFHRCIPMQGGNGDLNLSMCFENLKLIYLITVYRLHELTGSLRKQTFLFWE